MSIRAVSVKGEDSADAVRQIREALADFDTTLLLFFASGGYGATDPAGELQRAFPGCQTLGSTSVSEFFGEKFTSGSICAMAFDKDSVADVCIRVVTGLSAHPEIAETLADMHSFFGGYEEIFEKFGKYVGIVLFEAGSRSEEYLMRRLGDSSDILFVGGTSSSNEFCPSRVYANGNTYEDAAVLAVMRTVRGYDIIKTQSACLFSDRIMVVTKSDPERRILYELDRRPCGEVYAEVLGVPEDRISDYFTSHPLGMAVEDEIYLRSFEKVRADGISLYCGLPEGAEIHVLKTGDMVEDTRAALDSVITYRPAGVVQFNCLSRTVEMVNRHLEEPYCALFGRYPSIGFSTKGEAFLEHMNKTSTILVIR